MDFEPASAHQLGGILGVKVRPSAEPLIKSSRPQPQAGTTASRSTTHDPVRPTTALPAEASWAVPSRCLRLDHDLILLRSWS